MILFLSSVWYFMQVSFHSYNFTVMCTYTVKKHLTKEERNIFLDKGYVSRIEYNIRVNKMCVIRVKYNIRIDKRYIIILE